MSVLKKLKTFDRFIIDQFIFRFSILYIWTLITPIIYKLQWLFWTTSMISFYLICTRSAGLFVPYFKNTTLKNHIGFDTVRHFIYSSYITIFFYA